MRPFNVCRLSVHVRHSVADEPEQVKQLASQLEHWNWVAVLFTNWPVGQVHAPFNARRLPVHVRHSVADEPEQVKQLALQLAH
jgi:hypothetical protein